jgi:hypothetical protein
MAVMDVAFSQVFRLEQGVDQVDEEPERDEAAERIIEDHDDASEQVAGVDIGDRQREKGDADCHHRDVHHGSAPDKFMNGTERLALRPRLRATQVDYLSLIA